MDPMLLAELADFGIAGVIAAMWVIERRAASTRERELTEAHAEILERGKSVDALMRVVQDNTLALGRIESTQRELSEAVRELGRWDRVWASSGARESA